MAFTADLTNTTFTNNGAYAHKSTNSAVLDLFSNGVSSNSKQTLLNEAMRENDILTAKVALYLRDVRYGQGNRDILRALMDVLAVGSPRHPKTKLIVDHLPEIGRWKDVVELVAHESPIISGYALELIAKHFQTDALLAKWLPRQGKVAKIILTYLKLDHGVYRRHIAQLSCTVEQQMCKRNWSSIKYSAVPSVANTKYNGAFLRNDETRRRDFLSAAKSGEVAINSSVLYPHDIVRMVPKTYNGVHPDDTADALWSQLPNYMEDAMNILPVIDCSGSMMCQATGTAGTCLDVAMGLGLYMAEHNTGTYKDLWMNFSSKPEAFYLKGDTLSERMGNMNRQNWGMTTNVDAMFDFVLKAAKDNPKDAPRMILIVSDMEFNRCTKPVSNFDRAKTQFAELGVPMPTVVFWRVNVSSESNPVTKNEDNTILINGYSPTVLQSILKNNIVNFNPYTAMLEIIGDKYEWLNQ